MPKGGSTKAKAKAKKKTEKSVTGAQFYQSETNKKELLSNPGKTTRAEKAIIKALNKRPTEENIRSAKLEADIFMDMAGDAVKNTPKGYMNGGCVMAGRGVRKTKMG